MADLNQITNNLTAFGSFAELTQRGLIDGYSPTLSTRPARRTDRHVLAANSAKERLADAFDAEMARWGSTTRAFRG